MEVDYLIVGFGLAGLAFSEVLETQNKSFCVISDDSQQSSKVAVGLYNPVILKRFSGVWKSHEQLALALPFYQAIESKLGCKILEPMPVYRRFNNIEEQNAWFEAMDKSALQPYLSPNIVKNHNLNIKAEFGLGEVLQSGRVHTERLLSKFQSYLIEKNAYEHERFDHSQLEIVAGGFKYGELKAKHIVFCEGYGVTRNPFFKDIPLNGTKGEVMVIKSSDLQFESILKGPCFILSEGNDLYSVGATYDWESKTHEVSQKGRDELVEKVKSLISCEFEVVDQKAGIRPTVKDRRPLVGEHPIHKSMFVLNGLGTRGVMIAPYVAKQLFESIELGIPLDDEINVNRYSF
ncbi:NAD(P)/FAD-dependent oxidoreductase [Mangrovimonas futianensis]|uniref:NAD(P)/FAD-dependent oxidoreductase n=1 Tax=Mangrovimonas futianensis TaxID=2895523 RepID=UPI001E633D0C|nr:FAD-dependent oxidoreductase [Mangrovimonas futianensis]MCF1422550.1 FAD-binding oxidoreductase [Mangrovimonas futianensis]